jgi:hypothetical protein
MSSDKFLSRLKVEYTCPECKIKVTKDLSFISQNNTNLQYEAMWWCHFTYCEAKHRILYFVNQNKGKKPKINVNKFTSNNEVFNKRFRVLEWSGMESATKKGSKK